MYPKYVFEGLNALSQLTTFLSERNEKVFIVSGPNVSRTAFAEKFFATLDEESIKYEVFRGISGEPDDAMLDAALKEFNLSGAKVVIGLGGGSPMDAAKFVACGGVSPTQRCVNNRNAMLVEIPTTVGTGAEATQYACLTIKATGEKVLFYGPALLPEVAVLAPEAALECTPFVIASTAFDALTHAVEAFISNKNNGGINDYAIEAIQTIFSYLPQALMPGGNNSAIQKLAKAAFLAGVCICNSSVTVVHGMSRPIGAHFHIAHGLANTMLLTTCMGDIAKRAPQRLDTLAKATKIGNDANEFVDALRQLQISSNLKNLKDIVPFEDASPILDVMVSEALGSGSPANAPCQYTSEELRNLYIKAWEM